MSDLLRILFADDNESQRILIDLYSKSLNYLQYDLAHCGQRAIDLFGVGKYDVVVLDYEMPDINGLEVGKAIRKIDSSIPLVLWSANYDSMNSESVNLARKIGFNEFWAKPLSKAEFIEKVVEHYDRVNPQELKVMNS